MRQEKEWRAEGHETKQKRSQRPGATQLRAFVLRKHLLVTRVTREGHWARVDARHVGKHFGGNLNESINLYKRIHNGIYLKLVMKINWIQY